MLLSVLTKQAKKIDSLLWESFLTCRSIKSFLSVVDMYFQTTLDKHQWYLIRPED